MLLMDLRQPPVVDTSERGSSVANSPRGRRYAARWQRCGGACAAWPSSPRPIGRPVSGRRDESSSRRPPPRQTQRPRQRQRRQRQRRQRPPRSVSGRFLGPAQSPSTSAVPSFLLSPVASRRPLLLLLNLLLRLLLLLHLLLLLLSARQAEEAGRGPGAAGPSGPAADARAPAAAPPGATTHQRRVPRDARQGQRSGYSLTKTPPPR